PAQTIGAAAFNGPLHRLTRRILDQHLHPDVRVGPLDFLDRSHQGRFLRLIEGCKRVMSDGASTRQGAQERRDKDQLGFHGSTAPLVTDLSSRLSTLNPGYELAG